MSDIEKFEIDTNPALQALFNEVGGSYREFARVLGVSHSHVWHALNGTRKPISVNLLAKYVQEARKKTGLHMVLLINEAGKLLYRIERT